jgi:outer membrane protein
MKHTLWLAALATAASALAPCAPPAASQEAPRPIGLDEAVRLAQRNAPDVVRAQGQQRTTAAGVRAAYAAFLPNVSLSAGATRQLPSERGRTRIENGQVVTLPDEPWSSNIGLGANVTLFAGGQRFFELRSARAEQRIAGAGMVGQRYATAYSVKQQFYNVLAARESQSAAAAQLEQAEQAFRTVAARMLARSATRSDSLRAEIQRRDAQVAVLEARTGLDVANAALARVIGSETPVTADSASVPARDELARSDDELRALALDGPAVQQAELAVQVASASRQTAWSDYLPSLTASYSRGGSGSGESPWNNDLTYSGSFRLSLGLPLFDGLRREQQVVQAQVAQRSAEAELRDARLAAQEDLTRALGEFRAAGERIAAQTATLAAAQEDLRVQQQRYAVGSSTILDVLTSQTQLDQARRDLIRARYDRRVAKAQLETLVGQDL